MTLPHCASFLLLAVLCSSSSLCSGARAERGEKGEKGYVVIENNGWAEGVAGANTLLYTYTTADPGQPCHSQTCTAGDRWVRISAHHQVRERGEKKIKRGTEKIERERERE